MKKVMMASLVSSLFVLALCLVLPLSAYSVDNPKLIVKDSTGQYTKFVVMDTGNTGIGTDAPVYQLETDAEGGANSTIGMTVANSTTAGVPVFFGLRGGGTLAVPSATPSGAGLFWLGGKGWTPANGWNSFLSGLLGFNAAETFSDTANGTYFFISTTPIGSTTRAERMRINADGTVIMNSLAGSYTGGSRYVCVYNSGLLFTSESPCP